VLTVPVQLVDVVWFIYREIFLGKYEIYSRGH